MNRPNWLRHTRRLVVALPLWAGVLLPLGAQAQTVTAEAVAKHYAASVSAGYEDTLAAALEMQQAIKEFTARPSAERLKAARDAWRAAREWYGPTEAFRFYAGPIDDDEGPEGRINAWPMDESYVDYVKGKAGSGLIANRKVTITKSGLAKLNEKGGEENIATGWHAIEFLLWGQDLNDNGPGDRSFEDFVDGKAPNADRRRLYLLTVTELLIDDLRYLVGAWTPGATNYRSRFETEGLEAIRKMVVGIGSLTRGELAGERLEVAMNTQDQEDEHSCFSDNTHRDVVLNATGIQNVWLGRFARRDGSTLQGPSLQALVAAADNALAEKTTRDIAASVVAANAIQPPFDREIVGGKDAAGRKRVQAVINALIQQSKDLPQAAAAIGVTRLTRTK
ncbi:MAG TPA: imelysin family protein [Ideonella sp.]|uniref:imelysin family protein n=1 Tax=Ideonella sp. TaxID=1929293 RepID=UPI002E2F1D6D|nr:imelysin family protein [Ideonella sp.]HEX5686835.1 imelysin family protein [Ideonella sp.]